MLPVSIHSVNFLKDGLGKHIMEADQKYGPFLAGKSVP